MKDFMGYIASGCIAFTFSCIFYLLFSYLTIFSPLDEKMVINLLFISISIMSFIFLLNLSPIQSPLTLRIAELIIVIAVLLFAGAFFDMFPFNSIYPYSVIGIGVLTYAFVIIVLFISEQLTAKKINSEIHTRNRRELDE